MLLQPPPVALVTPRSPSRAYAQTRRRTRVALARRRKQTHTCTRALARNRHTHTVSVAVYTETRSHMHAHARTRTHMHVRTRTRTHRHKHAHTRTQTHAQGCTGTRTRTHTRTHTRTRARTRTRTHMHARTRSHARTRTRTRLPGSTTARRWRCGQAATARYYRRALPHPSARAPRAASPAAMRRSRSDTRGVQRPARACGMRPGCPCDAFVACLQRAARRGSRCAPCKRSPAAGCVRLTHGHANAGMRLG
jgi:hypothetical protein